MAVGEKVTQYSSTRTQEKLISEEYVPQTMPSILGRVDMVATYVCALFLLPNAVSGATGGLVSLTYLVVGAIFFFIPCIIASAQLGVLLPYEGALYNWTYHALGNFWSIFVSICYWLTGMLAAMSAGNAFVITVQGLNNTWLTESWQQGLVILGILALGSLLGLQRLRTTQHLINVSTVLTLIAVFLIGLAAVVWLVAGHASATNLSQPADWLINPNNFSLFGIITLNFIGISGPLNMAGEMKGARENNNRRYIARDLLWGALIIFICYAVATISPLIVHGSAMLNAHVPPFEAFTAVNITFGNVVGGITVVFILFSFLTCATFYSYSSARILMVAAIDHRIPAWFARLNKHRVPANAVIFQFLFSGAVTIAIFMVAPYITRFGGNAANTLIDLFSVNLATLTLIWTLATLFFFINIIFLYRRNPQHFLQHRILPLPIIWISTVIGGITCIATIAATLIYSWIPQLIPNNTWWYVVGSLSAICLIIAMIGAMLARSEADWEATLRS